MMMGQYWLGKTKPKQALRLTQNAFKKVATELFFKNYSTKFSID